MCSWALSAGISRTLADDDGQLAFPVERVRALGPNDGLSVRDLRTPHPQKDWRIFRQLAVQPGGHHFLVVVVVVADGADDLLRTWNHRHITDVRQRDIRAHRGRILTGPRHAAGRDVRLQRGVLRIGAAQVGDEFADDGAPGHAALVFE